MKKSLIVFFTAIQFGAFAQVVKPAPEGQPDCPPETCPGIVINVETFNFHKPRTSCASGFGFCFKIKVYVDCISCFRKSMIENGKATIYATIDHDNAILKIPATLKEENGFENERFDSFEVEDRSISIASPDGRTLYLKSGIYETSQLDDMIMIKIPLTE